MQMVNSLIRTKIRQPFTRQGLIPRPRLQARIKEGLLGPLTLVIAPAGFGKTTLVAGSLPGYCPQAAWLSLDRDDNQPGRFLTYLIAALQSADQRIGSEAAQLMAGMHQALPEAVMTSLINDLDAANVEMVLVLEDYHFISAPEVHAAVAFLLDHCPKTFHLLIATRSDPPLPFARLRARGQLVEVRAADLRFTETEAAQFLNDVMALGLDAGSVAALVNRTEGWAAGLQMASIALQSYLATRGGKDGFAFIEGFSGTNRHILDYLLEEILANQPPEILQFLLFTSILERMTASLCDAVLATAEGPQPSDENGALNRILVSPGGSAANLKYLERENLFLVALDDEAASGAGSNWFRYHHLFSDLLRARLQQTQSTLLPLLHMRASAWLEQNGFITEAIQHLIAAHEDSRAADLIERYGPARWAQNDLSIVQMADSLPREMLIERPKIGLYQAWLLINQGRIEKAYPLLADMAQQLASAGSNTGTQWTEPIIRLALAFLTPPTSARGADPLPDPRVLDEIPTGEMILRDAAEILYGMALGRRGEIDRAVEFSLMSMQKEKAANGELDFPRQMQAIPTLVPFLATMYWFQGRLHAAASLCREYLDPIKEKGIRISTAGNIDVTLGGVLYDWNCLEEAESHIRDGLKANKPWGNIMTDAFGLLALTHVLLARQNYTEAMQIVEKFKARLQGQSRPYEFSEDYRTLRARVQLESGDLQTAFHWADQVQLSDDYHLHPEYYRVTLARVRLAQGRYGEVEELLGGKLTVDLAGNRITRQMETNLLLAGAAAGQARLSEAFELIESCLTLAEPEGYLQVFLEIGEPVRELLAAYQRSADAKLKDYARKVLSAFSSLKGDGPHAPQPAGLVEPLSEREMEVLQLMALGRTNQQIARQLILAAGTIKAHAASIYRKLDAANRTEAVARARQMGILA